MLTPVRTQKNENKKKHCKKIENDATGENPPESDLFGALAGKQTGNPAWEKKT